MLLSRSGFDSEHEAFRADLNLNEFKEIIFIRLMGCLILNVPIVCSWILCRPDSCTKGYWRDCKKSFFLFYIGNVSHRRWLHLSTDRSCAVPCTHNTFGDRSFAAAGPRVWNSLPARLHDEDSTYNSFRH